jgi:hypothetical protein
MADQKGSNHGIRAVMAMMVKKQRPRVPKGWCFE